MQQPTVNLDSTDNQPPRHHTHSLLSASREGISNNLYHTPTPATTDSEVLGNLPSSCSTGSITRGYLFSPMENSANVSGSSFILGSLITPKRKLSLSVDLDESTQDVSDSGYSRGESISSTSSYNTHESGLSFSSALEGIVKKQETTSALAHRTPLGDVTNTSGTGEMRQHSQKAKRSISFPNEEKSKKMSASSENQDPICFHTRISSLPPLLSSQDSINHRKNSLHQISSPLERMTLMSPTPTTTTSRPLYSHNPRRFVFPTTQSLREHSVESDGYSEVFDGDDLSSNTNTLPSGLTGLMNAPFTSSTTKKEVLFSLHKPPVHSTPMVQSESGVGATRFSLTRADSWCPTTSHTSRGSLKRASPCPDSSEQPKKKKPPLPVFDSKTQDPTPSKTSSPLKGVQLLRSQSCSFGASGHNMFPLSPGDNGEMIGDHSKSYALPLCKRTSVPDLKCISPHTLAELVNDDSGMSVVDEYLILDCRYPYEYEGGHIRGAQNVWNRDTLQNQFFTTPEYTADSKRRIIIFHCEFSSKRGPDMSRFMREIDRKKNGVAFPKLYYPELYLLEGGYKAFYEQFPDLCEPNSYVKMLDDKHKEELRHFKHRSKSWTGGDGATCKRRGSKLRPRRSTIDSHREIKMLPSKS